MLIKSVSLVAVLFVGSALVGCGAASEEGEGDNTIQSHSAHFETFVGKDGKTYWDLVAGNGQNVLRSQGYTTAASAKKGSLSVVANGPDSSAYEILEAADGSYYFNLRADNNEIIGTSQMYSTKSNATRGASTVRQLTNLLGAAPTVSAGVKQQRFEVFMGEDKKFYFHLRASNGEIVLGSQAYTAKSSAMTGIKSVQTNGSDASRWATAEAVNGEYGIHLTAANNEIIAQGELYSTKSNATAAVSMLVATLAQPNIPVISE